MPKKSHLEREKQVHHIIKALPSKKSLEALGDPRKLPLIGLSAATQRYVVEAFDDCILHSAFSVELALLMKLDEKLDVTEKETIRKSKGLTFGRTIRLAEDKQILEKEYIGKVWILFNLRNMFAHPANWVSFIKRQSPETIAKMLPTIVPEVSVLSKRIEGIAQQEIQSLRRGLSEMQRYVSSKIGKFPELEWAAHQGTLSFQEEDAKSYFAPLIRDLLQPENFRLFTRQKDAVVKHLQEQYPYFQEIAYKALDIAFDVLKHLNFLH